MNKTQSPIFSDLYNKAMCIKDQQEADQYFRLLVEQVEGKSEDEAEALVRYNLGYWAGYFDHETRARVEKLYDAPHPVLGSASNSLTMEGIFRMGMKVASGEMKIPEPVVKRKKKRKIEW